MVPVPWNGLVAGLLATVPMTLWEVPWYLRHGMEGVLEWHENQAMWARLAAAGREGPADPKRAVAPGLLLHFAHGGVGGFVYATVAPALPLFFGVLAGVLFGWLLWLITLAIHRPVTGLSALDHPHGSRPAAASLVGHLLYGAVLGAGTVLLL